ncbi:hypothetical protein BGZ80_008689 [Entomortierella chlamydospora]|uniref:PWWP domain-containing protein n=1 Tax=Entomortierella chlamydospora TaxID=101097 RepID=A0A9P6N3A6_9FUNG|nr:hypothetical protein BGZ80_008689 [Entomortierella chlamydospora]
MTRAASSRKNSTGGAASSRPGPVFRGRDVVFVDPLDDKESYWWPAMIVPVPEIDSSMDCTVLNPGECLVKYFEDNKYSVVPFTDLQPFVPTTIPFLEFELAAGQKFLKNGGVVNAMAYLESGKVKRKFSWHRWGTAQNQDLNLDMLKHKPITLPLISDEAFQGMQQHSQHGNFSSVASSPTTSTKNYTDSETDTRDSASSPSSADERTPHNPRGALKNGMQRSLAGIVSQPSTLLPSPVSLNDPATESMDETEFNARSTRTKVDGTATKDSPTTSKSRSRRGSRETDSKASTTTTNGIAADKETSKRSRNASEQSSTSSSSTPNTLPQNSSATPSSSISPTAGSLPSEPNSAIETAKRRKTVSEQHVATDVHNGTLESSSSRQGSAEPGPSPRSTRHSSRNSKTSENGLQGQSEDHSESLQEAVVPTRLQTHRMTRQRSAPKSASSLPSLPPPSPISLEKLSVSKDEPMDDAPSKETGFVSSPIAEQNVQSHSVASKTEDSMAMDVDPQESNTETNQGEQLSSSTVPSISSASSTSSPSSIGLDDGTTTSSSSVSSNGSLIQSLELERKEMDYSFEHVLPTLAIGSKEREAFYESCMDHLQRLRQEHRRLKEILKDSDYTPKGRRATRSSPHHGNHRNGHHHLEEKPNRRISPAPAKGNSVGANNKEANGNNATASRSNSSKAEAAAIEETSTTVTTTSAQVAHQGIVSDPDFKYFSHNTSIRSYGSGSSSHGNSVTVWSTE